jgi:hypothetical protein
MKHIQGIQETISGYQDPRGDPYTRQAARVLPTTKNVKRARRLACRLTAAEITKPRKNNTARCLHCNLTTCTCCRDHSTGFFENNPGNQQVLKVRLIHHLRPFKRPAVDSCQATVEVALSAGKESRPWVQEGVSAEKNGGDTNQAGFSLADGSGKTEFGAPRRSRSFPDPLALSKENSPSTFLPLSPRLSPFPLWQTM